MLNKAKVRIDRDRLRSLLDGVNAFGRNPATGGFNRLGYSKEDMSARRWFADSMRSAGLDVRLDAVGNVFGRFGPPEGPAILAGSHLDTVAEGGAYDGALGAVVALESVLALSDCGHRPTTAIEVVATAEEEGRFGGMLGSQAIAGAVTSSWLESAQDANGVQLSDALLEAGLDPSLVASARRAEGSICAFLELHIEQGPVLESIGKQIGLVTAISGVNVLQVTLDGQANHSGTTPMDMRADAFAGMAEAGAAVPAILERVGTPNSRITIGKVDLKPNDVHTVPGRAEFSVVIRDTDVSVMHALRREFERMIESASANNRLRSGIAERSFLPPVALAEEFRAIVAEEAAKLDIDALEMPSGAGHDAQIIQSICPAALIFTPSRHGISHDPAEFTDWDDIVVAADLYARVLERLSSGPLPELT